MSHQDLFAFENDFVETLRCIPMAVRFKLDTCGVKLSLRQWSRLTPEERRALLLDPCSDPADVDGYRSHLVELIARRTQEAAKGLPPGSTVPWEDETKTPEAIRLFAHSQGVEAPEDAEWRRLSSLRRFVLLKLSRDNHDNVNFIPALKEFGLYRVAPRTPERSYSRRS